MENKVIVKSDKCMNNRSHAFSWEHDKSEGEYDIPKAIQLTCCDDCKDIVMQDYLNQNRPVGSISAAAEVHGRYRQIFQETVS